MSTATTSTTGRLTVDDGDSDLIGLFAEDGDAICYFSEPCERPPLAAPCRDDAMNRANAAEICRRWNSFGALIEACDAFLDYYDQAGIDEDNDDDGQFDDDERLNVRQARAAIRQARGETT